MATLLLAVFTASAAFGVLLPQLPELIERVLGTGATAARIAHHTGLLTAVYPFALFLFAPAWGRLSDRHGCRGVLLAGKSDPLLVKLLFLTFIVSAGIGVFDVGFT